MPLQIMKQEISLKLKLYHFGGSDSSSDAGYWEVIIVAKTKRKAVALLNQHARALNRTLTAKEKKPAVAAFIVPDIIFSNMESK